MFPSVAKGSMMLEREWMRLQGYLAHNVKTVCRKIDKIFIITQSQLRVSRNFSWKTFFSLESSATFVELQKIARMTSLRLPYQIFQNVVYFTFISSQTASGFAWIVTELIFRSTSGRYVFGFTGNFSSSSSASKPSITRPNIVYLRSSAGCAEYVMKNWLMLEFVPELAIETMPRSLCLRLSLNSSSNFSLHIDLPFLPVLDGSPVDGNHNGPISVDWKTVFRFLLVQMLPVCTMKPLIFRMNWHPL